MANTLSNKRDSLNLHILPGLRALIDRGAEAQGKNRTDFILDAAKKAAEEALLDRTMLAVSPQAYKAFLTRLERPAEPNPRLRRAMQTPAPWDPV